MVSKFVAINAYVCPWIKNLHTLGLVWTGTDRDKKALFERPVLGLINLPISVNTCSGMPK